MSDTHVSIDRYAVIVNDNRSQLNLLAALIRKTGLKARTFLGAESALKNMQQAAGDSSQSLPTLIVSDLYMPDIDGWRFCRLLRSDEYQDLNHIPVIVVSATFAGDAPDRIARDLGIEAFLSAPVDAAEFVQQVNDMIAGHVVCRANRVLLLEDSRSMQRIIEQAFSKNRYEVDSFTTLQDARDAVTKRTYDFAVLDYHLPDGLGDELLDELQVQQPSCVVVMMTTDTNAEHALNWMKRGAAAYLRKPFAPEYLIELCARSRRERSLLKAQDLLEVRTRELRDSEARFRSLVESTPDWVWACDEQGVINYSNSAFENILGIKNSDVVGHMHEAFIPESQQEGWQRLFQCGIENCEGWHKERVCRFDANGNEHWFESSATPVMDENGEFSGYRGVDRDITESLDQEEKRKKLLHQFHQAQKIETIGQLAGGLAHDFNNMLGVILGNVELAMDLMDEDHPAYIELEEVRKTVEYSAALPRQLLAFSAKHAIQPVAQDINETLSQMLKMLRRLIGKSIELVWQPGAGIWPVYIDPIHVDQIIINLCVNARDAIESTGKVTIETRNIKVEGGKDSEIVSVDLPEGEYVMIGVSDTGKGMNEELAARVFEPFFTTKRKTGGTGLGLSVVQGIMKQNGGAVGVMSELGKGSVFHVFLPRFEGTLDAEESSNPELDLVGSETVLVIEDEPAILKTTCKMLERLHYKVIAASTPSEALRLAEICGQQIDLVLSDVVMPEMNGWELTERLITMNSKLKFVFMSGYVASSVAESQIESGSSVFVQKPFSRDQIGRALRRALNPPPI